MERADLVALLESYLRRHAEEAGTVGRILGLIEDHARCFERDCLPGHITASAWIVSRERGAALLTHHRKLDRWLQLGGHADGDTDVLAVALREAEEESGLRRFVPLPSGEAPVILDVDVHDIPARGSDPAHEHHDIRFLLEVSEQQPIRRDARESKAMRWFAEAELAPRLEEESLARMARKAQAWLARAPVGPA